MTDLGSERIRDEALLIARILLAVLFLVFGWGKLTDYSGTVAYMTQSGAPLPSVAALVAIVIEFFGAIALILGVWTRPLAVLFAFFTLAAGLIGHRYWTTTSADRFMNMINFYKTSASWAVSSCCTSRAQENTQSTQGWDCLVRRVT
jgi:putative oxidoreductase